MKKSQLLIFIWISICCSLYAGVDIRLRKVNLYLNSDQNWTLDIAVDLKSTHMYKIFRLQGSFAADLPISNSTIYPSNFCNLNDYDQNIDMVYNDYFYIFYFQYIHKDNEINYQNIAPEESWIEVLRYTINWKSSYGGNNGNIRWRLDDVFSDYSFLVEAYFQTLETVLNVTGYQVSIPPELSLIVWPPSTVISKDENSNRIFRLFQNYPNPFNPETNIEYEIDSPSQVSFSIFNTVGKIIREIEYSYKYPGRYLIKWDGLTDIGDFAPSGIYYYKIVAGHSEQTKKMIKLK